MIGRSILRVEDAALLTGEAGFADDAPLPSGAGRTCFVRSPWLHAHLLALDTAAALIWRLREKTPKLSRERAPQIFYVTVKPG